MGCTDYNYSEKEKCDHANDQIVTHVLATIMIFNRTFKVCMFYLTIRLRARVFLRADSQRGTAELTIARRKRGRVV